MADTYDVVWDGRRDSKSRGHLAVAPDMPRPVEVPTPRLADGARAKRGELRGVVLEVLQQDGPLTVLGLAARTGRSPDALNNVLYQLRARRQVTVVDTTPSRKGTGRPMCLYGLTARGRNDAR